jgi:two-component system, OmpR family, alkaline phosphatase synthesis response regulator PhoP
VKSRKRVLVVDDQRYITELLGAVFEQLGFTVELAFDGQAALATIGHGAPDVMVLDVRLPELDGWQVLEALRREPGTARLPVVMMSASGDPGYPQRARRSGAQYLEKPFPLARLVETVEALVSSTPAVA